MTDNLLTIPEASQKFDKAESTIRAWIRKGWLSKQQVIEHKKFVTVVSEHEIERRFRIMSNKGRRTYNTVRTDTLESKIGFELARLYKSDDIWMKSHHRTRIEAFREIAVEIGAPINEALIESAKQQFLKYM